MNSDLNVVLEYKLIQQTPLIHFQYDEPGACLRATEVKPKLDRYLIRHFQKENIDYTEWIISEQALNYKMSFNYEGTATEKLGYKTDYDIYYGNMGNTQQVKGVIFKKLTLRIVCLNPLLRAYIQKLIEQFFIVTNFGRMQGKGFGSFILDSTKKLNQKCISEILKDEYGACHCYYFPSEGGTSNAKTFKRIKIIYGMMKSGINFKNYQRSMLFDYMHKKEHKGNEKAALKQMGIAPSDVGKHAKKADKNYEQKDQWFYVRALLGIGDHMDFLLSETDRKNKMTISIKSVDKSIERLNSPIFFKVINGYTYYVGCRINEEIYGKEFEFSAEEDKKMSLTVPTKEQLAPDFIDSFLHYCKEELNSQALDKFDETKGVKIREV